MRNSRILRAGVAVCSSLLLVVTACGGRGLKSVDFSSLPVQSSTPEELVERINRTAGAIASLKGKLDMGLQKGPRDDVRSCSAMLLLRGEPGAGLYLKGYRKLIPTFFTMVSDGRDFWFHIPREDAVYTGPVESRWSANDSLELYINAGDLFRALLVAPINPAHTVQVREEGTSYVASVENGDHIVRSLWVERKRFTVVRELYYDSDGLEQLEIQRKEYVDVDGRLYPASIVLRDVISGSSVFLDFNSITLNPENVPDGAFRFAVPEGVEVKRLEAKKAEA